MQKELVLFDYIIPISPIIIKQIPPAQTIQFDAMDGGPAALAALSGASARSMMCSRSGQIRVKLMPAT